MKSPNIKPAFNTKLNISEADILMDFLSNCKFEILGGRFDIGSKLKTINAKPPRHSFGFVHAHWRRLRGTNEYSSVGEQRPKIKKVLRGRIYLFRD